MPSNAQAPAGEAQAPAGKDEELPAPPTPEEQSEQSEAYKASGKKIDDMIAAAGKTGQGPLEMNFERVIESFYMSALIQMGAIRQGEEQPQVDIIGARQTIDSLSVLQEKPKAISRTAKKLYCKMCSMSCGWPGLKSRMPLPSPPPNQESYRRELYRHLTRNEGDSHRIGQWHIDGGSYRRVQLPRMYIG